MVSVRTAAGWLPALLVVAGALAWANALGAGFVFDDRVWIVTNPEIRSLRDPWRVVADTSRPVLKLTLAANYAAGGLEPLGYHLVNRVIHVLAALALFGVVRLTLLAPLLGGRYRESAPWLAAAAALLWLLHPLQTQAVSYVVQRGESLMGLAYLATLYCSIRAAEGSRPLGWALFAVLACAIGMGTKEVMVTAPLLVLLHDRTFRAGSFAVALRERTPLYAGLAATWAVPFGLIGTQTLFGGEFARPDLPTPSAFSYALTQPGVLLHYLRLSLWPSPLCFDYQWPVAEGVAEVLPAALVVAAALVAGAVLVWRRSGLGFLFAWFFLILAPTSSFLPIADIAVEHRMYLPLAAVAVLAVLLADRALAGLGSWRPRIGLALALSVAVALGVATVRRNRDYEDLVVLWRTVTEAAPGNARGHYNLGTVLAGRDRLDESIAAYRRSIELDPDRAPVQYNLGNALTKRGEPAAAIRHFERAVALEPEYGLAHGNLAGALRSLGRMDEAALHYRRAVEIDPRDAKAHHNLGVVLEESGHLDQAVGHYRESVRLRPQSAWSRNSLGNALLAQGRTQEAIREYKRAISFDRGHVKAHHNLGAALEALGYTEEAIPYYERALELDPGYEKARRKLEAARERSGAARP